MRFRISEFGLRIWRGIEHRAWSIEFNLFRYAFCALRRAQKGTIIAS
jgi:hypothetical protein